MPFLAHFEIQKSNLPSTEMDMPFDAQIVLRKGHMWRVEIDPSSLAHDVAQSRATKDEQG